MTAKDDGSLADIKKVCIEDIGVDGLRSLLESWDPDTQTRYLDDLVEKEHADSDSFLDGYVQGFPVGVFSVWDQVKDHLYPSVLLGRESGGD
jgi:hypothetical protein